MVAGMLSAAPQRTGWQQAGLPTDFHTMRAKQTGFAVQAARYSETFQLNLTTREGDRVSVNFRQMLMGLSAQRDYSEFAQRGRDVAFVASRKALEAGAFEARFGLHVQGNLNEEERKALKNIFQQIAKLADAFYGGDMQRAARAAQQLTADPEQIASMKLSMSQAYTQVSVQHQAVSVYRETAQQTQGLHPLKAAQQVQRYWQQVQQVQAVIQQTFRQFSLSIEFVMGGGDKRQVSMIEQVHEQIAEAVETVKKVLGEQADDTGEVPAQNTDAQPTEQPSDVNAVAEKHEGATMRTAATATAERIPQEHVKTSA